MKFNKWFLGLAVLGLVFASCEDDTDPVGPTITFKAGAGLTTGDATVDAGDTVHFSWEVVKGDANLEEFTIREGNEDIDGFPTSDIDNDQYEASLSYIVGSAGTYVLSFIATDKDGLEAKVDITITCLAPLESLGAKQLGAGGSSLGSYYSVSTNLVYNLADAKTNASKIDIIFTSTASAATFKSPKDASATEISSTGRTTTFQKVDLDFETAGASEIEAINPTADNITVELNDVVVFKTHDNEKGIFLVDQLTVSADGSVTIDIKVK
ncbi:MAG: hypothetical protein IPM71_14475 [Bacteroidota bacterium]|nr:MAG: hypothetical protein IPM71_14475 [Bacteroidota bacterium]